MQATADVLLVTVTPVESLAVLAAIEAVSGRPARLETHGDRAYHDLGTVNGAHLWMSLSEMGAGGLGGAQMSVGRAIAALRPAAVIMIGIAFGVNEKKQSIGDILVSQNLRLYDLQRVGTDENDRAKIILRGDRPHASTRLLDACRNALLHWHGAEVRPGCVLTGDKLVDNQDFRNQLLEFEQEAVGGDMEGAGLYTACQEAKVDWILVKGICDWGDGHKADDKNARQALAARNAAEFVAHVLQSVSLKHTGKPPHTAASTGSGTLVVGDGNATATGGGKAVVVKGDVHGDIRLG